MLQDVIHPPTPAEQHPIDEISSPISARIFELCDPDFFPETLQNSEVTSSSNCCHEGKSSYATTISPPLDVVDNNNKININSNIVTTSSSTTTTGTTTNNNINNNNNNNVTNSNNLSIFFDSQEEIDNDISASIDFSSSPSFVVPPLLPITTQQEQFDFSSAGSVLKGLSHQYTTDPVVAPLMGAPLPSVFDDDCISSIPSYVTLNSSSPTGSYLNPGIGVYMPPGSLHTALSADSAGLFGGNILLGSELQAQELDYQGENGGGIYCTDSIQRVFNPQELQALGNESQKLVTGAGSSAALAPEISHLEDSTLKVGKLSVEQRKEKIHRYMKKRNERNFSKKIKVALKKQNNPDRLRSEHFQNSTNDEKKNQKIQYACRKTLADSRPRVRGRFAKNDDFGEGHRQGSSNHEEDDEEIIVKEDDDMVDSSDIFAHISGINFGRTLSHQGFDGLRN